MILVDLEKLVDMANLVNLLILMNLAEMEKRADGADASVLFFSLALLIFWLCTHKLDIVLLNSTVLLAQCL